MNKRKDVKIMMKRKLSCLILLVALLVQCLIPVQANAMGISEAIEEAVEESSAPVEVTEIVEPDEVIAPAEEIEEAKPEATEPAEEAEVEADEVTDEAGDANYRATGTTDTGIEWTLDYQGNLIITGVGEMYTGYSRPWYNQRTYIRTVTISDGITTIGKSAFSGCSGLRSVDMPDSVLTIEYDAFYNCEALPSIKLSKNVTSIGSEAFYSCDALATINLPDGLESIGNSAFAYSGLTAIVIPDTVTDLGEFAFNYCTNLVTAELPANITEIHKALFQYCSNLLSIQVPSGVTSIGPYAFNNCANLATVTLPDTLYSIEEDAFQNCDALTKVTLPESLTYLGKYAFNGCDNLTTINIPKDLGVIEDYTFQNCNKLTGVVLPEGLYGIGNSAFRTTNLKTLKIPNTVSTIGSSAFYGCTNLASVTLPTSITAIPASAFYYCESLTSVVIPDNVVTVEGNAFYMCDNLTNVVFGEGVRTIGYTAFQGCNNLSTIHFLGNAPSISNDAFKPFLYTYKNITGYYPANNSTWNEEFMSKNYTGGNYSSRTITWVGSNISWLGDVEIYEVNAHHTGNILRWNAVKNADIYQIFRLEDGQWKLLKNTRGLAHKDETAEVGVKHYYKVIARNGDVKSDIKNATSVFAVRPLANVTITKTTGHETGNILNWDAVAGANLYQVYRLENGKWTLLKNTGSLAYKDETAPVGVKTYYKVVARCGNAMSTISTTTSVGVTRPVGAVSKLDVVTITKTTGHSTGNILNWKAVTGAKLYQVFRLENGKWTLLTNTGSLAYKDTTAPVGVKTYYKVIARNGDVKSDINATTSVGVVRSK